MNRHAWLQKHPSPVARGGEFHWYPADGDRELRAAFVERARGVEPPAVLWQLEPGRVAWAQLFATTAPHDGRRYVGLVVSVVAAERSIPELLSMLAPPPARPWQAGQPIEAAASGPAVSDLAAGARRAEGDVAGAARALMSGGSARVDDPGSPTLPRWLASIERLLPPPSAARAGALRTTGAAVERDRLAALVARAWAEPTSRAGAAWTLARELAGGEAAGTPGTSEPQRALDRFAAALDAGDPLTAPVSAQAGALLTRDERAAVGERARLVDVLHTWGRGRFDAVDGGATRVARLAEQVAFAVFAQLARDEDGAAVIAHARWHALLPAERRTALLGELARRAPSLRRMIDVGVGGAAASRARGARAWSGRRAPALQEECDG